uniref:Transcription factor S-II n=1 Tax=Pithovirus LCPAC103 TaxID=2506588 RepID=A0A481Z446_9VIRU|nr:MAG: transcription factor S-II [Pithovirus LCPAC103]
MEVSFRIAGHLVLLSKLEDYLKYELSVAFPSLFPDLSIDPTLKATAGVLSEILSHDWQSQRQLLFMLPTMKLLHDNMVLSAARYLENKMVIEELSIPCRKCGDKKVSAASRQTRSADEQTTTFFACFGCGETWREG